MKHFRHYVIPLILACTPWFFFGCNLFGFVSSSEDNPAASAQQALNDGNSQEALKIIEAAPGYKEKTDPDLLFLHAKATLIANDISIGGLVSDIIKFDLNNPPKLLAIPPPGTPKAVVEADFQQKDKLFQTNKIIINDLEPIIKGKVKGGTLITDSSDVEIDYAVSTTIKGVLSIRDLNGDGAITYAGDNFAIDIFNVLKSSNPTYTPPAGAKFNLNGAVSVDPVTGQQTLLPGLSCFLPPQVLQSLNVGVRLPSSKIVQGGGLTPENINPLLGNVLALIEDGGEVLDRIIARITGEQGLDPKEVKQFVDDAKKIIVQYWYDDDVDNDGDGKTDEEFLNGLDDDKDGQIDEDTQPRAGTAANLALPSGRNTIPERFKDPSKRRRK
jgi:hypothetical protein